MTGHGSATETLRHRTAILAALGIGAAAHVDEAKGYLSGCGLATRRAGYRASGCGLSLWAIGISLVTSSGLICISLKVASLSRLLHFS